MYLYTAVSGFEGAGDLPGDDTSVPTESIRTERSTPAGAACRDSLQCGAQLAGHLAARGLRQRPMHGVDGHVVPVGAGHDVDVQVVDLLSGRDAIGLDEVVPIDVEDSLDGPADQLRRAKDRRDRRRLRRREGRDVALWDDEGVPCCDGCVIEEGEGRAVLVDAVGRLLTRDDRSEDTLVHATSPVGR